MKRSIAICHYCELPTKNPSKDHVFPISKIRELIAKGEPLPPDLDLQNNKVLSCGVCNSLKANKDYDKFKGLGVDEIRRLKRFFLIKYKAKKRD